MLSKKKRLTTAIFDQVFKTGAVKHSTSFWVRKSPNLSEKISRYAVAASKKVGKTAVLRNRIKRLLYRAVETIENKEKTTTTDKKGSNMIIGVKKDVSDIPFEEIVKEIKELI